MSFPDIVSAAFAIVSRRPGRFLLLALPAAAISCAITVLSSAINKSAGLASAGQSLSNSQTVAYIGILALVGFGGLLAIVVSDLFVIPSTLDGLLKRPSMPGRTAQVVHDGWQAAFEVWLVWSALAAIFVTIIGAVLFIRRSFAMQEVAINGASGGRALKASTALVAGHWWRVALIQVAIGLLASLPGIFVQIATSNVSNEIIAIALGTIAYWIAAPFLSAARTVLYADIKLRRGERVGEPVLVVPAVSAGSEDDA